MAKIKKNSKSGQTMMEYILVISAVVIAGYAMKAPAGAYLVKFFSAFSGRAVNATVQPSNLKYVRGNTRGCSSVTAFGSGAGSCE
jgi:hypothetical protein